MTHYVTLHSGRHDLEILVIKRENRTTVILKYFLLVKFSIILLNNILIAQKITMITWTKA